MQPEPYSYRADPAVPAFDDRAPLIIFDGDHWRCSDRCDVTGRYIREPAGVMMLRLMRPLVARHGRGAESEIEIVLDVLCGPSPIAARAFLAVERCRMHRVGMHDVAMQTVGVHRSVVQRAGRAFRSRCPTSAACAL